jgi:5-methylcytosine-specific restriction endonuclease McrA
MNRKAEYQAYLNSPEWKLVRSLVLKRDGKRCIKCHTRKKLTVHHIKYPDKLGTEPLDYMQTLCKRCHSETHGFNGGAKSPKKLKRKLAGDSNYARRIRRSSPVKIFSKAEISAISL